MNHSDYLKKIIFHQSNAAIGLSREGPKLHKEMSGIVKGVATNISSGFERLTWKTSCWTEKYQDVCEEIKYEDSRALKSLKQLSSRRDAIGDMILIYCDDVISHAEDNKSEYLSISVMLTSGLSGMLATSKVTKQALSYMIAREILSSKKTASIIRYRMQKNFNFVINMLNGYGKVHQMAMAARRLKLINQKYYLLLVKNDLEMLYYFIEPVVKEIDGEIKMADKLDADMILKIVRKVIV